MAQDSPKITMGVRAAFGGGGATDGIFRNSHYFVLIYYSQVLGLEAGLAGLAMGISLIFDAITDPLVGYLSDNTRSRWGRRHPWLFGSIIPLAASFYFLWYPPAFLESDAWLFTWLLVCNITMRTGITMFLVPAYAILAEVTADYDERTRLLTSFHMVQSVVMNGMSVLMYGFWLVPTDEISDGIMNIGGYQQSGLFGTIMIIVACLIFSIGLRRFIPQLKQYKVNNSPSLGQFFRQVSDVFKDASARIVLGSGAAYFAGLGAYIALWAYIYSYFWAFTSIQIAFVGLPMALAPLLLPRVMARITAGREKKTVATMGLMCAMATNIVPITLSLLGFFPERGSDELFYTMLTIGFFETIFLLMFEVSWRSMITDLTERIELKTGRRNEGVIASTIIFSTKCANALGTLIAGVLLTLIMFPTETSVEDVPLETIGDLGLIYGTVVFFIWVGVILCLRLYDISRASHEELLKQLAENKSTQASPR
jgi:glycoside/pentoside/hexuronide:cation symporter, GPH family